MSKRFVGVVVVVLSIFGLVGRALGADFTVTNNGATAYIINAQSNPGLTLTRGHTYTFAVSTAGHPFWIKSVQVTGTGSSFDTGVTNNGTSSGTLTFTVPVTAPATLYYICEFHSTMSGVLTIVSAPVPAGSGLTRAALGAMLAILGFTALGRLRRRIVGNSQR